MREPGQNDRVTDRRKDSHVMGLGVRPRGERKGGEGKGGKKVGGGKEKSLTKERGLSGPQAAS